MIFSENLFPLESDCGIMEVSTNRDWQNGTIGNCETRYDSDVVNIKFKKRG